MTEELEEPAEPEGRGDWSVVADAVAARGVALVGVAQGSYVVVSRRCWDDFAHPACTARGAAAPPLDPVALTLLRLLAEGRSGAEAAEAADLTLAEVAAHLSSARRALGVSSTATAVEVAHLLDVL